MEQQPETREYIERHEYSLTDGVANKPVSVEIAIGCVVSLLDNRVAFELQIRDFTRLQHPRPKHRRVAEIHQPVQGTNLQGMVKQVSIIEMSGRPSQYLTDKPWMLIE